MERKAIVEVKSFLIYDWNLRDFLRNISIEYLDIMKDSFKGEEVNIYSQMSKLIDKMTSIYETRPRDFISYYDKGKPITNYVKGLLNQAVSQLNYPKLGNNQISKLLNNVRSWYSKDGILEVILKHPEFFNDDEYQDYNWGDNRSCFRSGGCNRGNYYWIKNHSEFFRLVLFIFKDENGSISRGRCWGLFVPNVDTPKFVLLLNFYSYGFNIQDNCWRLPIAKAIEEIYNWKNAVVSRRLASNIYIPFYRNSYSFLVYRKGLSEEEILGLYERYCYGECSECNGVFHFRHLDYDDNGDIVCEDCRNDGDNYVYCARCDERIHIDDAYYSDITEEHYCEYCYHELFTSCGCCGCELYLDDGDTIYLEDVKEYICRYCFDNGEYGYCDECGGAFTELSLHPVYKIYLPDFSVTETAVCRDCFDTYRTHGEYIEINDIFIVFNTSVNLKPVEEKIQEILRDEDILYPDIDDIILFLKKLLPKYIKENFPNLHSRFIEYWDNKYNEEVNAYEDR